MITITDLKRNQYNIKLSELMFIDFSNETTANNIVLVGIKDKETLGFTDSKEEESKWLKLTSVNEFKRIKEYLKGNEDYYAGVLYYYTLKNIDFIYEYNGGQHIDGVDYGDNDIPLNMAINTVDNFELQIHVKDINYGSFIGFFKNKNDFNIKNGELHYKNFNIENCKDFLSDELLEHKEGEE
jgi:hypothetical protein